MSHLSDYPWLEATFKCIYQDAVADRLAHALLLSGSEGIGVPEFSSEVAAYRLCFNSTDGGSCGQCKACALLAAGTHPDLKILEPEGAAQIIKVDQVRELVNFMSQTPQIGEWKVAIIRPAQRMNINAANAVLKVLEEPPGQSLLLLATERPQVLLPTVRSRCTQLRLPGPDESQVKDFLVSSGVDLSTASEAIAKLGLKPLLIAEWISSDQMSNWKMFLNLINTVETRQVNAVKAASALKNLDIKLLINWLIEDVAAKLKKSIICSASKQAGGQLYGYSQNDESNKYQQVYDLLIETKQTLDSGANPNVQLTLESVFLDWPVRGN